MANPLTRLLDPVRADRERVAQRYRYTADARSYLVPLALGGALLIGFGGCGLFGEEDFGGLAPGTFRMEADGGSLEGVAAFYPNIDLEFSDAQVIMEDSRGSRLGIGSNDLLTAEAGDRITPSATYRPAEGGTYLHDAGIVLITYADSMRVEGTFRFEMIDRGGPLAVRELTVEGGFNATVKEQ
jgi:hypothetical protein